MQQPISFSIQMKCEAGKVILQMIENGHPLATAIMSDADFKSLVDCWNKRRATK